MSYFLILSSFFPKLFFWVIFLSYQVSLFFPIYPWPSSNNPDRVFFHICRAEVELGEEFSDEGVPKSDLGKIVTVGTRTFEDGKLIGTDLPKARDRDGLEEEILKEVEKIKKIKSPTMQYRQKRMLSANFINDRYGRILGQEN